MKIFLRRLTLTNFKGIRSFTINFQQETNIYGRNEAGKTTLMDAFLWLFFGKDSSDRKDFEIKTLDENNQAYHRLDHEVSATIEVDKQIIYIRRVFKEKWVKKRGSADTEFTGHETTFYWNDVPMKEVEYMAKISAIVNESLFKLLSNTSYFNSLKWQDRRNCLLQIAGIISNEDVFSVLDQQKINYEEILQAFSLNKSIDEFKREISAKKKKIKDDLILIPSRIDEANRSLPDEKDYEAIEANAAIITTDIESIDGLLNNKSQAHKAHQENIITLVNKRQATMRLLSEIEFSIKNEVQERKRTREQNILDQKSKLRSKQDELNRGRSEYLTENTRKEKLVNDKTALTDQWYKIDEEQLIFKEGEFCCPACKREFEPEQIDEKTQELTANFNTSKSNRLADITAKGKKLAEEITAIDTKLGNLKANGEATKLEIDKLTNLIAELEVEHTRLSADEAGEVEKSIASNVIYQEHKSEVDRLNESINAPYTAEDNSALLQRKKELSLQLDNLKQQLSSKGQREKQLQRITELTSQENTMAQELASLEGIEYSIEQFTKAKMDALENKINGRFKIVKFKMFEDQINGGQVEACTTLIKGVPYSDANNASKIQAGLDIINTLSEHYGIQAPVWVDNRESVTILPETDCQLINLIVSPAHKKLTVGEAVNAAKEPATLFN